MVLAVLLRPIDLPPAVAVAAALSGVVAMWPVYDFWRTRRDDRPTVPLLALVGLFYAVFFVFPAFYFFTTDMPSYNENAPMARLYHHGLAAWPLVLVGAGLLSFYAGFVLVRSKLRSKIPRFSIAVSPSPAALYLLSLLLVAGHLVYILIPEASRLASIGQFLVPAGYAGIGLIYLLGRRRLVRPAIAWTTFTLVVAVVFMELFAHGFFSPIVMFVTFLAVLELWCSGRISKTYIIAAVVLFAALVTVYPLSSQIRAVIWKHGANLSTMEKSAAIFDIVYESYFGAGDRYLLDGKEVFRKKSVITIGRAYLLHRFSGLATLAYVVRMTPQSVPYWRGTTYANILTNFIPRVFWKDKPEERWGNAFGQRYGLIGPTDTHTSVNFPWITELYANFGWVGIVAGMFVIGLFLGALERIFASPDATPAEFVVGATVLLPLFYQESNFTLMTGTLVPLTVCLWIYFLVGGKVLEALSSPGR